MSIFKTGLSDLLSPPPTLKRGNKGDDVCRLQYLIGARIDGDFGAATESAVKSYQKNNKLTADGVVGPATWKVIMAGRPDPFSAYPGCSTWTGKSGDSEGFSLTKILFGGSGGATGSSGSGTTGKTTGGSTTKPSTPATSGGSQYNPAAGAPAQAGMGLFGWTLIGIAGAGAAAIIYNKRKAKPTRRGTTTRRKKSTGKRGKSVKAIIYE